MAEIEVTHYTDPGCPFAYSAIPAHSVLRWRYGSQLRWRLVMIGLAETADRYIKAGRTPAIVVAGSLRFRGHGMPFLAEPRARVLATARACRAVVATRLLAPAHAERALRALQFGWFTSTLLLDEDGGIAAALGAVPGLDVASVIAAIDAPATLAAYEEDRLATRTAEGGPTDFQGKARQTDGPVRYSAPSIIFGDGNGRRLEAGGFQPLEAYDVLIANLDPTLHRRGPAEDPLEVLRTFPDGLVTQEVAAIMAPNNVPADRAAAEQALLGLLGEGRAVRIPIADDALWRAA